jgi:hypothetical protein
MINLQSLRLAESADRRHKGLGMIPFAILSFLVGAVLGTRWRVLMLLPTCAALVAATIIFGLVVSRLEVMTIALDVAMILLTHQTGFLFGALVRGYLAFGARQRVAPIAKARI